MLRENKKESVANLHKKNILENAEKLFISKGYIDTTIEDISNESQYSRRTIYSYFPSKEEIANNIVLRGLRELHLQLADVVESSENFNGKIWNIFEAMKNYYVKSSFSFDMVEQMKIKSFGDISITPTVIMIFEVGKKINDLLEDCIERGKEKGVFRKELKNKETVYILWANISSLFKLAYTKGDFLTKDTNTSIDEFLNYGFKVIINSILEERL